MSSTGDNEATNVTGQGGNLRQGLVHADSGVRGAFLTPGGLSTLTSHANLAAANICSESNQLHFVKGSLPKAVPAQQATATIFNFKTQRNY